MHICPPDIGRLKYAYAYFAANHKDIYIYIYIAEDKVTIYVSDIHIYINVFRNRLQYNQIQ